MDEKKKVSLGKFISLILRHKPEIIGIELDKNGWANVDELLNGINKTRAITFDELEEIVNRNNKNRYSFNEEKTKIRANQGHSINVDVELNELVPPNILYHGTSKRFLKSIMHDKKILSKSRLYVHLSETFETAEDVGKRHGEPFVFIINTARMSNDGFKFYKSVKGELNFQ